LCKHGFNKRIEDNLRFKHDESVYKYYFKKYCNEDVVYDRFHISEAVYSYTLRNKKIDLNKFERRIFGKELDKVYLIYLDVKVFVASKRILERDNKVELQDLNFDREMFRAAYHKTNIKHKIWIDNNENVLKTIDTITHFLQY